MTKVQITGCTYYFNQIEILFIVFLFKGTLQLSVKTIVCTNLRLCRTMAIKRDKIKQDNGKVAGCVIQESTKKDKTLRKQYSSKKTEFQVRKRTAEKITENTINENCKTDSHQYNIKSKPAATMFYPPCPQYYPVTNEWSPVFPVQCPLYSLPIPVIVNPILSTQISQYAIVVPPVTVTSEFAVSPLVPALPANEFSLHMTEVSSPIVTNESPIYCEVSPIVADLSNGYASLLCNEVAFTPMSACPSFATSNETPMTPTLHEYSPFIPFDSYEFSPATQVSDVFSPINNIQVPNEFIPICTVANEISPLSNCEYEPLSYEYFECDLPMVDSTDYDAQDYENVEKPLEYYLLLPKDLFPTAWMMTIDPNSIIDEFCRVPDLHDYSWILDLEFGVPKTPVTRRVATYNVKLNSIHCKNAPEAIHPGFEDCDKELKRALMFYYDCVISNWYRGYISLNSDRSVENFQLWLLLPMQVLGMCWP